MSHTGKEGEWMKRITKIDKTEPLIPKKLRVAAYCRVSTGSDEQLVSLEAQKSHYESFIKANPEWESAGVYYDEGITGTKKEKRTQLLKLISDCEAHKVDFIVVKSISRFARNTTDCLELVRKLTDLGVFIYFEKENINTQSMESELMLGDLLIKLVENVYSFQTEESQKYWARTLCECATELEDARGLYAVISETNFSSAYTAVRKAFRIIDFINYGPKLE